MDVCVCGITCDLQMKQTYDQENKHPNEACDWTIRRTVLLELEVTIPFIYLQESHVWNLPADEFRGNKYLFCYNSIINVFHLQLYSPHFFLSKLLSQYCFPEEYK